MDPPYTGLTLCYLTLASLLFMCAGGDPDVAFSVVKGFLRMAFDASYFLPWLVAFMTGLTAGFDLPNCVLGQACWSTVPAPFALPVVDTSFRRLFEKPTETNMRLLSRCSLEVASLDPKYVGYHSSNHLTYLCNLKYRRGEVVPVVRPTHFIEPYATETCYLLLVTAAVVVCRLAYNVLWRWKHPARVIRRYKRDPRAMPPTLPAQGEKETLRAAIERTHTVWTPSCKPRVFLTNIPVGVPLNDDDWAHLLHTGAIFTAPNALRKHADVWEKGGQLIEPLLPVRTFGPYSYVRVTLGKDADYTFYAYHSSAIAHAPHVPTPIEVDGRHFLVGADLVTMMDVGLSGRESVPRHLLSSIATRLATDESAPNQAFDRVGAFLRSALKANDLTVTHMHSWVVLVCGLMNNVAFSAGNSIVGNTGFGSGILAEFAGRCWSGFLRRSPFHAVPVRGAWQYEDEPVPTYEVFAPRNRVDRKDPLRPEKPMPFQVVRPEIDATADGEQQCSASPDGQQCAELNGAPCAGTSTDTEPAADRPETPAGSESYDLPPASKYVYPRPDVGANGHGVDGDAHRRAAERAAWGIDLAGPLDDTRDPASTTVGDCEIHLVPVGRPEATVPRWDLLLLGDERPTLRLIGCFDCAVRASRTVGTGTWGDGTQRSAYGFVANYFVKSGKAPGCVTNNQGLPPVRACAHPCNAVSPNPNRPSESTAPRANAVQTMGAAVPIKTSRGNHKGNRTGRKRNVPNARRFDR